MSAEALSFSVDADATSAEMVVGDECPMSIDLQELMELARAAGIRVDSAVETAIKQAAVDAEADPTPRSIVVATCLAPIAGDDGFIEWMEGFDPDLPADDGTADSGAIDHYRGENFIVVTAGDHIATIHPPTAGTPGLDVKGEPMPSQVGRTAPVKIGQGLLADARGLVSAQMDGVLLFDGQTIRISNVREVAGDVDFKTGHIDFDGSIRINGGVLDRFRVTATGSVFVAKLIQAATITCDGDLQAPRGVAARGRGEINVGGNAGVGYLNNVRGRVQGDLEVAREIISCELVIGGALTMTAGAIIGGVIEVAGSVSVVAIGAAVGTTTRLILGGIPFMCDELKELEALIRKQREAVDKPREEKAGYEQMEVRLDAQEKKRLTGRSFELSEPERALQESQQRHDELAEMMEARRCVEVRIKKIVHAGTVLEVGDIEAVFARSVKGPFVIGWDTNRDLLVQTGSGRSIPMEQVARCSERGDSAAA